MKSKIYKSLEERKRTGHKSFAVLIDPDKVDHSMLDELMDLSIAAKVDYLLVGGSLVISNHLDDVVQHIKQNCLIPVILFPGRPTQLSKYAVALLLLPLFAAHNPKLLMGQFFFPAPAVKQSGLEILPTAYMVIDG